MMDRGAPAVGNGENLGIPHSILAQLSLTSLLTV